MRNIYCILVISFFCCFFGNLLAQEKPLPLLEKQEAISAMLANNFGVQLANNQVAIAENNKSILNSGYLPGITGNAGATYELTDSETDFGGALDNQGNTRPNNVIENAETNRYNASINLDYTLFDGLGRYYNYQSLKENYNLSQLEVRETIENTMLQLFSVYYEVARLEENVAVLEEVLSISKNRLIRVGYQFDYGQVNRLEVLNAEVDITTDSINVINARQNLENTRRDLNVVLNREVEQLVSVDTTLVFLNELQLEGFVTNAFKNNVSILQAEKNITISDFTIRQRKALLLPTIGLTGSYGWNLANNPASAFFPSTTNTSNALTLGASLRWNLFDGGQSITGVKNAKILKNNQELLRKQLELEILRDIANAKGNYKNALMVYTMQEQNVVTNQANFERSQERLKLGQITSVEFRQAQVNLLNAKTNKNAAKYTAKLAELQLLQVTGQLLNVSF